MDLILMNLLSSMLDFKMTETQFRMISSKWKGMKEKRFYATPHSLAMDFLPILLTKGLWTFDQLMAAFNG